MICKISIGREIYTKIGIIIEDFNNNNKCNNKSGLLIKSSRLEISELRNYFSKI